MRKDSDLKKDSTDLFTHARHQKGCTYKDNDHVSTALYSRSNQSDFIRFSYNEYYLSYRKINYKQKIFL